MDPSNIGKISLHQEYNVRYKQMEFLLIVNPKYANGIEGENLYFKFKTEEERDFWFDVLKKKIEKFTNTYNLIKYLWNTKIIISV